jgi:hypothetical protein
VEGNLRSRLIELISIVAAALIVSAIFYSDWARLWLRNESPGNTFAVLLAPALLVAYLLGGVHSSTQFHFSVGLVVEFLLIWALVRFVLWLRRRLARGGP